MSLNPLFRRCVRALSTLCALGFPLLALAVPPTVQIAFAPATIQTGTTSRLTITLGNANAGTAALGAADVDDLRTLVEATAPGRLDWLPEVVPARETLAVVVAWALHATALTPAYGRVLADATARWSTVTDVARAQLTARAQFVAAPEAALIKAALVQPLDSAFQQTSSPTRNIANIAPQTDHPWRLFLTMRPR